MSNNKRGFRLTRKSCSKAISWALSASMLAGACFTVNTVQAGAQTLYSVSQGDADVQESGGRESGAGISDVSGNALPDVSGGDLFAARKTGNYNDFTADQEIANLDFGTDVTNETIFDADSEAAMGFRDIEFATEAIGWKDGVYYPREASREEPGASYVENGEGCLAISSKVWTETESSGYGVYTYENTSTFDMVLANADYQIDVTFVNPADAAYTVYVEAEDIGKVENTEVAPGTTVTKSFTAVLVDGVLNLKFPVSSSAVSMEQASVQKAYVSNVTITRLATQKKDGKPTIYLSSDSTVQTYEKGEYPKTGWGQTLAEFFGDTVTEEKAENCTYGQSRRYVTENVVVENRAIGGRSSKSFVEEGKLDDLLEDIKEGDYLFIQWGHNDATAVRPNRYVSPGNFAQWLMYYVDGARQRGAVPVLVTPVARYSQTDGVFHISFGEYRDVMLELAKEQGVALVDLGKASTDLCTSFGAEGAKSFFMKLAAGEYENYPGGSNDDTHLQYYGAYKFAQCVAKEIAASENGDLKELAPYVKMSIPSKAPDRISNVRATALGSSSISFAWDKDADAEMYYIYRRELSEGEKAESVTLTEEDRYSATSLNKYTDSGCEEGKTYAYAVAGFNEKGTGEMSETIVVSTKEAGIRIDFNYGNSPTMEGWISVNEKTMYGDQGNNQKYGWITSPGGGRDRAQGNDMERDFVLGEGEFAYDLPNGDYEVTIYSGDITGSSQKTNFAGEGLAIGTASSSKSVGSVTGTVRVKDGQMNIVITKGNGYGYTNGMTVTELLLAPGGVYADEIIVGNTASTFQIFFTEVDGAASYRVYLKNSTDAGFGVAKTITPDELHGPEDVAARTIPGDTGEIYECYVTAVMEDGTESAPSEVISIELVEEGPKAPAPENLICISPSKDAVELQREITMGWDEVPGAIKYVIYRNDKTEGDKGYDPDGFVKTGESKTNQFTDTYDITTNVPYSYKVAAFTKTGIGELSKVCVSNVSGTLVPGAQEKYTDRALVAINLAGDDGGMQVTAADRDGNELTKGVYLSWRSFEADRNEANELTTAFTVKRNGTVIAENVKVTNLVDEGGSASDVYTVEGSSDAAQGLKSVETKVWADKYLELKLYAPEDEKMPYDAAKPDNTSCTYQANDMSVGDLNGDGDLELIVKWYPDNAQDNSGSGFTGKTFLDGYDVDFATGAVKLLWRIDLGVNIRSGAHYTQFQVWDYDGDGKAEIAVKTADGTTTYQSTDGTASGLRETGYVGACNADALPVETTGAEYDYRNGSGYILDGPEYLTMFNGEDGTILDTADYLPARGNVSAWGDGWGNRVDRFLSATAYLDGETPFAVFARGYYTRTCLTAYYMKDTPDPQTGAGDGIGDTLDVYWEFDSNEAGTQYEGQGNHGIGVNDIDNDGKDEIIYGALVIDHNGAVKYSTGLGHGDAMHISDWASWNEGLEIMSVHEHGDAAYHVEMRDAQTGEILMGYYTGQDTGRGVAADIDPTAEGAEWWSIASPTYEGNDEPSWDSTDGEVYSSWSTLDNLIKLSDVTPASNASIFWDGDLLSEIQDHKFNEKEGYVPVAMTIYKWNYETQKQEELLYSEEVWSNNGTKGNTGLTADILGDWREEIIVRSSADHNKVRIYSTTIQTDYVVPCLLENLAYREAVAWQNVGYNQPANLSYLLSEGLVTAQLGEGTVTGDAAEILFTPANDGKLYGHEITGYEIYRAEGEGDYEKIDTVAAEDLKEKGTGYSYTDKTVKSNTEYAYRVAAVVDNKTSHMSRTLSVKTAVRIAEVPEIVLDALVEGTPVPDGETVAALLPETVKVIDEYGQEQDAEVTWDVTAADIDKPGEYKVYASVDGYDKKIEVVLRVIPNEVKSIRRPEDIVMIVGTEAELPASVTVEYTNTTVEERAVTWDTSTLKEDTAGEYVLTGTVEGITEKARIVVKVKENYVVSVDKAYAEIEINTKDVAAAMPRKVSAGLADGTKAEVEVSWNLKGLDTSVTGTVEVTGMVKDYEGEATAIVNIVYPLVQRFDFGIDSGRGAEGWTTVTVNKKGGKSTAKDLGIAYTAEQGYGFENADAVIEGRTEEFTQEGALPANVYTDFVLPAGQTFLLDVENGTYEVELVSTCGLKGSTGSYAVIEGVAFNVDHKAPSYASVKQNVEVKDGRLTVEFTDRLSRTGALVVRSVPAESENPQK